MKPLPKRIYKYEQMSVQSLQNLKSQIVYFGSPRSFNDPYDCALVPAVGTPTDEEAEKIREEFVGKPDLPVELREPFQKLPTQQLKLLLTRVFAETLRNAANEFLDTRGVTCFSETPESLLMWSHYGGRSQGFCLEFDTAHEPFNRLLDVTYTDRIPTVPISSGPLFGNGGDSLIRKLYCTKSKHWEYEQEWRAIHQNKNTRFTYPAASLTGVYFGPDSLGVSQEIICLILQGQNENVRFYQGQRSEAEFKVQFKEFTYTSHLKAKAAGLV